MASKEVYFPGPRCKSANISVEALSNGDVCKLDRHDFSKGILYELSQYRKANDISWDEFYDWILKLTEEAVPKLETLKVTLSRLDKSSAKFKRNKQPDKLESLMDESILVGNKEKNNDFSSIVLESVKSSFLNDEIETLKTVNLDLAGELQESEAALSDQKLKTDELAAKLSKLSVRNVNKRLKRRDEKIMDNKHCIDSLTQEVEGKSAVIRKLENKLESARSEKECYRGKLNRCINKESSTVNTDFDHKLATLEERHQLKIDGLDSEIVGLRGEMQALRTEYEEMRSKVEDIKIETHVHGQLYNDNVHQCCYELLSMNVGIHQVDPIIRSVLLNIAGMEVEKLPKPATLVRMLTELKCLSYQQIADELQDCKNITLHSDGTSKFGQHYGSFQISTDTTAYSLGLSEMLTGSAQQTLDLLKQILNDFQLTVGSQAKSKLLTCIKNTMSDRHIVQKNFNSLLEEYRAQILPEVITSWQDLSSEDQQSISSLNNFFCGLHLLVGIADVSSSTLLQWEATHFSEDPAGAGVLVRKSESGTVRLIRTACKAFSKHGCEQSGVYQSFTTYLLSNNITKNPLLSFRGNRFNILFYDAGALYYISPFIEKFFTEVWQTPNQLLRAVLADVKVPEYLAGCKALGLVNKIVTGPLWRVMESQDATILNMNEKFCHLKSCLEEWSQDATSVLSGEAVLYSNFLPTKDRIFESLVAPSVYDATAEEILKILLSAFSSLISRLVEDQLPGGKYHNPSARLIAETKSVPTTNVISERDFGKLDRFLREKPNASTLSLEAMIMFTNNKTASWLNTKTLKEREEFLKQARCMAPEFKHLYKIRRQKLLEERAKLLRAKRLQLEKLQTKKLKEKEELAQEIMKYGLWQSKDQVQEEISKIRTKKEKIAALKLQLDFRKKVLEQKHADKTLFFITKGKKQLAVDEITENLCYLLNSTTPSSSVASTSLATNCESLIGKQIFHRWKDMDGKEKWYKGQVLGLVPGTSDWYNVQYDGENDILSLNLLVDIDKGDLEILN